MKKSLYSILALMAMLLAFTSCEKDEIENTAIVTMAGEWDVVVDAVDENGNVLYEDPYGEGTVQIATYNLASNGTNQMWLDDQGTFWNYKLIVDIDLDNLTFSCPEKDYDAAGTGTAIITDGKITPGGAVKANGMPNDAISFYVVFSDDDYAGVAYDRLWGHGMRHTGFTADD